MQALGIPHVLMSASDIDPHCAEFVLANFPDTKPTHFFPSLRAQTANQPCLLHEFAACPCVAAPVCPDFAIVGSPCHPYSTSRSKRYAQGSVKEHRENSVMMDEVMQWIQQHKAKAIVMEQVEGFDKPIEAGSDVTPQQLPLDN